jgi:hypothetical protein
MNPVPRRLAVLFLLAVTGVLVAVGLVVAAVLGTLAAVAYAVVALSLALAGAQLAKRRLRAAAFAQGRTCTCCTGSIHDPVQVI